ncbi:ATP-dependent DNA helicase RecG [Methylophaga frappieri]|uniref:ATP-dependent DNA helicase RecG n=1 Tax=Methylophaga frappieri (strain ATCC BAA-2434 / DSM 25690 / JAM7) TaxID=754477 RepID=I1YHT0_METFJ|nr:ATP-dependent DNA helicase RecG [Methylophaga frappieri]AFJ02473.1 ATP-dependent DNA helicase RecG [Methylophaga frappieri]
MSQITLQASVTALRGVGEKLQQKLNKLGITRVSDVLFHLPLRYQDRTRLVPLGSLRMQQECLIEGVINLSQITYGRRRALLCHIGDGSGSLILRFFHFGKSQQQQLAKGQRIRCFGEVRQGPSALEMIHPEYQLLPADEVIPVAATLTPVYPTTEGLHQLTWRKLIAQALTVLAESAIKPLPDEMAKQFSLLEIPLEHALKLVHQPPPEAPVTDLVARQHPAQKRLAFEELLAHQLSMRQLRQQWQQYQAPVLTTDSALSASFLSALPFSLTVAQQRVVGEIYADLQQPIPMQRLVQGDVGSGKTVVSALAAIAAVAGGYQAAIMAPTELLAEQHYQTYKQWLLPLGVSVGWCSGKQTAKQRRDMLAALAQGETDVLIGTHALFQDQVQFQRLALVVIDEQHRFGVHQRLALRDKGHQTTIYPHQLVMTATPIPRTLAMTAYADLQVSIIDSLPPGRQPVTTVVVADNRRQEVIARIHAACQQDRQVYWVCTLIEESEHLQCQAAEQTLADLQQALPDLRLGLVHGRMKSNDKEAIMQRFKAGEIDLLVATTVIEVGVDVPNASLMVIENAERLGLAQLHQLRGRVGRGEIESHCVLLYHPPLSENGSARLTCLRENQDGFEIARRDLEIRGPGELLGTRQTGLPQFRIADLLADAMLLDDISAAADRLMSAYPEQVPVLIKRWFAEKMNFGQV